MTTETSGVDTGQNATQEETTVLGQEGQHEAGTSGAESAEENQEPRVFTQEELDAAIEKRIARERRAFAREQEARSKEAELRKAPIEDLHIDDFASAEDYADAVIERRMQLLTAGQAQIRQETEIANGYDALEIDARSKYADFEAVAYNDTLTVSKHMAEAIKASANGAEVLYHLGKNPAEAAKIAELAPTRQVMEIAKLEGKLAGQQQAPKTTSSAPPPLNPLSGRPPIKDARTFDPMDPKLASTMDPEAWIKAERARKK